MKKTNCSTAKLCFAFYFLFYFGSAYSQSSTLGHFAGGFPLVNWCGWDALTPIPLNIEHRGNQRINFLTYGYRRMFVDFGASGGQTTGRTAIGNDLGIFGTVVNPVDRLTLYEVTPVGALATGSVQIRFQGTNTGVGATNGYAIGMEHATRIVNHTQYEKDKCAGCCLIREMQMPLQNGCG